MNIFLYIFMSGLLIDVHRSDSSSTDMDKSGSNDNEWFSKTMVLLRCNHNSLFATDLVASMYYMIYVDKNDARIPEQTGFG